LLALARQHLGEKYVLGVLVPKDNAAWKGPWDCAEFASWVVFQATGQLYGCSDDSTQPSIADAYTGFWQQDAQRLGQIVSVELASCTAGAFVLRTPQHGAVGHIVISDGKGGTVEAHSSKYGVIASKLAKRRWDKGIFVPGIQYTQGLAVKVPTPIGVIYRLTTPLMVGEKIREIQEKLKTAGFDCGGADGILGPQTHAAVVAFQLTSKLVADGEVGPLTARALRIRLDQTKASSGRVARGRP
jgi:hypothetical protein